MKTQKVSMWLIGSLSLALASTVLAAPGERGNRGDRGDRGDREARTSQEEGDRQGPRGKHHRPKQIPFKALDADESGDVDFNEWKSAHDARLEKRRQQAEESGRDRPEMSEERMAERENRMQERMNEREERLKKIFNHLSGKDSGSFSQERYREAVKKHQARQQGGKCDKGGPRGGDGEGKGLRGEGKGPRGEGGPRGQEGSGRKGGSRKNLN